MIRTTRKDRYWPFSAGKPVIGVIHLPPLPGSPRNCLETDEIIKRALREAECLLQAGFNGLIIENFGDVPFHPVNVPPETVATMTAVVQAVRKSFSEAVIGLNVLRNDALAAMAIAAVCRAQFIRVNILIGAYATDQGIIEGKAADLLRKRKSLAADVAIFADVHVKHATCLSHRDIAQAATDTAYRGLADALIVTGPATGAQVHLDDLRTVKAAAIHLPVLIGSGVTAENAPEALRNADGIIVGSFLRKQGLAGEELDPQRVAQFASALGLKAGERQFSKADQGLARPT